MRRSIPTYVPLDDPAVTEMHRSGMSCKTPASYTYDANGHRRWCSDCGAELGRNVKLPADPATRRVNWVIGLSVLLAVLFAAAFFLLVNTGIVRDGAPVTPSPTPAPTVVHSMP